jgi:hypothetical protein
VLVSRRAFMLDLSWAALQSMTSIVLSSTNAETSRRATAFHRLSRFTELPLALLALLIVPALILEERSQNSGLHSCFRQEPSVCASVSLSRSPHRSAA